MIGYGFAQRVANCDSLRVDVDVLLIITVGPRKGSSQREHSAKVRFDRTVHPRPQKSSITRY